MQAHVLMGSAPCCSSAHFHTRAPVAPQSSFTPSFGRTRPVHKLTAPTSAKEVVVSRTAAGKGNSFVTYYFDPLNPENVVEVVAKPAAPAPQRSSPPSNGYAVATTGGTQVAKVDESKMLLQLQLATQQLEAAKNTIQKLRQYELMYKESKMRTKQMSVELASLQTLLADKDAELARQYKRMEKEAAERSGLRTQYTSALEEVRALRQDLEEARAAMLELRNALPSGGAAARKQASAKVAYVTAGSSTYATSALELQQNGGSYDSVLAGAGHSDAASSNSDVLHGLSGLAAKLAEGMEHEVGSFFGRRDHHK